MLRLLIEREEDAEISANIATDEFVTTVSNYVMRIRKSGLLVEEFLLLKLTKLHYKKDNLQ